MVEKTTHELLHLGAIVWTALSVLLFFALFASYVMDGAVSVGIVVLIGMIAGVSVVVLSSLKRKTPPW